MSPKKSSEKIKMIKTINKNKKTDDVYFRKQF